MPFGENWVWRGPGRQLFAAALLLVVAAFLAACSSTTGGAAKGKQLFNTNCSSCHGDTGARIPAAPLDSPTFIQQLGETGLTKAIAEGKGTMPAWGKSRGGPLADDQIKALVTYLKGGGQASPLPTGPGRSLYTKHCATCHGDRGNRIPAADFSSAELVSTISVDQLIGYISSGKGTMPAFGKEKGGPLTDDQSRQVAEYVQALSRSAGSPATEVSLGNAAKEGKAIFSKNCASCHGDKGNRIPANPMNDKSYVEKLGDAGLTASITGGKGTMPAFGKSKGGPLSDSDVKSLVAYVDELAGISASGAKSGSGGSSVSGKDVYAKNCAACHGDKGNTLSNADLSKKDFVANLGDGATRSISDGKGAMPGFKSKLKDDEVKAVLDYIKTLAGGASASPAPSGSAPTTGSGAGGPPNIPHDLAGRDNCLSCHGTGGLKPVPASHSGRTNETCKACHKAGGASGASPSSSPSGSAQPSAQPASGPPQIPHTLQGREGICLSCHAAGGLKPVPATHQGRDNNTCTGCHQVKSGGGAAAAPAASSAVPRVPHTLQDKEGKCLQCHGPSGIATVVPVSHTGRTSDSCTGCHISTAETSGVAAPAAKKPGPPLIPHDITGKEDQCLGCHGPSGLKPIPANHKDVKNEQCVKCHELSPAAKTTLQAETAHPAPDTHVGRTNDTCAKCHDKQFPAIP